MGPCRVRWGNQVLLAVDVGNTETVFGVFEGPALRDTWRVSTHADRTPDELALLVDGFLQQRGISFEKDLTGVVVASVVPDVTAAMREMLGDRLPVAPVIVGPGTKTGVPILTENPREVGADRVVNTLAAFERFGGPAIVVDFGTATNFDVVSAKGEFLGGVIAPGIQASAASLFARTARLTRVELITPPSVVGRSTVEAIQSGLLFGTAGQVDSIVERIRAEIGPAVTVATGGLAPAVIPHCKTIDHHEPSLTLEGLRLIYEKNADD
jgi:type III pantothenate kinase